MKFFRVLFLVSVFSSLSLANDSSQKCEQILKEKAAQLEWKKVFPGARQPQHMDALLTRFIEMQEITKIEKFQPKVHEAQELLKINSTLSRAAAESISYSTLRDWISNTDEVIRQASLKYNCERHRQPPSRTVHSNK